ncbi:hypothetical protein GCM10026982_25820 [Nocardiopsis aegyptia]
MWHGSMVPTPGDAGVPRDASVDPPRTDPWDLPGPRRRAVWANRVTPQAYSPFHETGERTPRLSPTFDHRVHTTGCPAASEVLQKAFARAPTALGDHLDTPVVEVRRRATQPQFQGSGPRPPAETHALDAPAHPRGQPNRLGSVPHGPITPLPRGDTFLTDTPERPEKAAQTPSGAPERPRATPQRTPAALSPARHPPPPASRFAEVRAALNGRLRHYLFWQRGQLNEERFMNASRTMAAPQRPHGRSRRP